MKKHCCDRMNYDLDQICEIHTERTDCPDALIYCNDEQTEYGMYVHDGGTSYITISYCPWCGTRLDKDQADDLASN